MEKPFWQRPLRGKSPYRCTHVAWSIGQLQTVSRPSFHCENDALRGFKPDTSNLFVGRLRCVRNLGRHIRYQSAESQVSQAETSLPFHVANLRMLKFRPALRANENPCGHLSPPRGDSQKAGGHLEDCTNLPTGNQKHNQVLSVSASRLVFGAVSFASNMYAQLKTNWG
jgi:hypothetical protein